MIRRFVVIAVLLSVASPTSALDFKPLARGIIEACRGTTPSMPDKPIVPKPGPISVNCDNCNGVGKIGDGTIMLTCPECEGTGKKKQPAKIEPKQSAAQSNCADGSCGIVRQRVSVFSVLKKR